MNPEQIREAVTFIEDHAVTPSGPVWKVVFEAARAYADLLENQTPVLWCSTHWSVADADRVRCEQKVIEFEYGGSSPACVVAPAFVSRVVPVSTTTPQP